MPTSPDLNPLTIANALLAPLNLRATSFSRLQSLWASYGQICRITITPIDPNTSPNTIPAAPRTLILKLVTPPASSGPASESHLRKIISYQVEHYFYTNLVPPLRSTPTPQVSVADCLASINEYDPQNETSRVALILSDLRTDFSVSGEKRGTLDAGQVHAAIKWLGGFHGFWWKRGVGRTEGERERLRRAPMEEAGRMRTADAHDADERGAEGHVWLNGGYTYLATRRTEYTDLVNDSTSEWSSLLCNPEPQLSIAEKVAAFLAPSPLLTNSPICAYETLIHGDVKSENLFATSGAFPAVAFFDFQYVGLGLGVCDLAKLFTCSVPESLLTSIPISEGEKRGMDLGERELLEAYLNVLRRTSGRTYKWELFVRHWETALVDWLRFQASWGFWGNTEWLEARVRHILGDEEWKNWLEGQLALKQQ